MENVYVDERHKRIIELIDPKKHQKFLVIGTGFYPKIEQILFNNFGCKNIISGDIDLKNLSRARKVLPSLKFIFLDAQKKFPFKNKTFDKVIFTEVLEHLADENLALNEIRRVLKGSGSLIITVPRRRWFNIFSPATVITHKREYNKESITKVLSESGFKIKRIFTGGSFYDWINLWIHLVYKWIFKSVHVNSEEFLRAIIDKSYRREFKGKGTDIFVEAKLN